VVLALWLAFICILFLPALPHTAFETSHARCSSDLEKIGALMQAYNAAYGVYPDPASIFSHYQSEMSKYTVSGNRFQKGHLRYSFVPRGAKGLQDIAVVGKDDRDKDGIGILYKDGHCLIIGPHTSDMYPEVGNAWANAQPLLTADDGK
jgi:hypothetical protein